MVTKRTRMRFDINDDITLLREVVTRNPFCTETEWKQICRVLLAETQKLFSVRSVREHAEHLIKLYKKQDMAKLRKSGTEKQYDDKERLLRKVVELHREFKKDKSQVTSIKDATCVSNSEEETKPVVAEENLDLGITEIKLEVEDFDAEPSSLTNTAEEWLQQGETADAPEEPQCSKVEPLITLQVGAVENATQSSLTASSIKERFKKLRQNSCLNLRNKTNIELQRRKLDLEERRIAVDEKRHKLQEKRFELEKYEREQRLELERKDREIIYKLIEQQKQIIDFFIHMNDYRND